MMVLKQNVTLPRQSKIFQVLELAFGDPFTKLPGRPIVFENLPTIEPVFNAVAPGDNSRAVPLARRIDLLISCRQQVIK